MKAKFEWKYAAVILLLGVLLVGCVPCTPCPPCPPTETPVPVTPTDTPVPATPTPVPSTILWEPCLDQLHAEVISVAGARYELVAAWHTVDGDWSTAPIYAQPYITVSGAGGATHMFAIVYAKDGSPLVGKNVLLTWPDGQDGRTTWDDGSVNFFTNAVYFPDKGERGPYCIQPLNGQILCGGGLPYGNHYSIFGVWRERQDYKPTLMQRLGMSD